MTTFRFSPKWKEELVVTGPGGSFVLMFWMGVPTVDMPDAATWAAYGPLGMRDQWQALHDQLRDFCAFNNVALNVTASARWYPA